MEMTTLKAIFGLIFCTAIVTGTVHCTQSLDVKYERQVAGYTSHSNFEMAPSYSTMVNLTSLFTLKLSQGNPSPDDNRSFWRMFFRFIISTIVALIFMALIFMASLYIIGNIFKSFDDGLPMIVFGVLITYFWILWAAYCSYTVIYYSSSPKVVHHWMYYVVGFFFLTGPVSFLASKQNGRMNSYGEQRDANQGTTIYALICIGAFVVFCIWDNLLDLKLFGWLNNIVY